MSLNFNNQALNGIAERFNLKFVILHGSYATGKEQVGSDVDIAIVGNKQLSLENKSEIYGELAGIFGDSKEGELDLKTLQFADPFFRYEVTRVGQLLFGDRLDYENYKASSRLAYNDAAPLFDLERKMITKYQKHLNNLIAQYA